VSSLDNSWRLIRFENLEEDIDLVCRELNVNVDRGIPRLKSEYRPEDTLDYRDLYDSKSKAHVEAIYADWFQTFSYKF
jgi:hypothetical protein